MIQVMRYRSRHVLKPFFPYMRKNMVLLFLGTKWLVVEIRQILETSCSRCICVRFLCLATYSPEPEKQSIDR
jgi:hypothetical protein